MDEKHVTKLLTATCNGNINAKGLCRRLLGGIATAQLSEEKVDELIKVLVEIDRIPARDVCSNTLLPKKGEAR